MDRRHFLAVAGAAGLSSLAGCSGGIWDERRSPEDIEYALQSDRIYRERPVRTDAGLVLTYTYAVGDTGYRFQDDGEETMLFPTEGWFLLTTVNWLWEESVPGDWRLDPAAFSIVVDGEDYTPLAELPRDIEWSAVDGVPGAVKPHFAAGSQPDWSAQQGLVNLLFDVPKVESAPYFLRWHPSSPVDGSGEPIYLTSTYGPHERGDGQDE